MQRDEEILLLFQHSWTCALIQSKDRNDFVVALFWPGRFLWSGKRKREKLEEWKWWRRFFVTPHLFGYIAKIADVGENKNTHTHIRTGQTAISNGYTNQAKMRKTKDSHAHFSAQIYISWKFNRIVELAEQIIKVISISWSCALFRSHTFPSSLQHLVRTDLKLQFRRPFVCPSHMQFINSIIHCSSVMDVHMCGQPEDRLLFRVHCIKHSMFLVCTSNVGYRNKYVLSVNLAEEIDINRLTLTALVTFTPYS